MGLINKEELLAVIQADIDLQITGVENVDPVMRCLQTILDDVKESPAVDAVPLDGSFLKLSKDGYVIFQREWLYDHLEQEFDILRRASGRPTVEAIPVDQIRKDIERRRAKGQHLVAEAMEAILQIWQENL